jgi:hypothetical protein
MLRFPYQRLHPARLPANAVRPPSLLTRILRLLTGKRDAPSIQATTELIADSAARPFVTIRIQGPVAARRLRYALLDTGSQDTLFPAELAEPLGIVLGGTTRRIRWRGQPFAVELHIVELELGRDGITWRWRARVGFTTAPLAYALLGQHGCLEFLDATFRGGSK